MIDQKSTLFIICAFVPQKMGSTIRHSSSGSLACCLLAAMAIACVAYLPSNFSAAGEMPQDSIKLAS
ncbi:MAG TPA: hypothetical protein VFT58_03275, partial [Nitrososphaera sp.]|nr:hypothetical protein [Nitrososphaera sp.]